jgi:hypothetical protein
VVRGRGGVGCPDHRGGAESGHMFIGRGGFGSPMILSRSAPLPSLTPIVFSLSLSGGCFWPCLFIDALSAKVTYFKS